MKGNVLLRYQSRSDPGAQMGVEELGDVARADVFPALKEAPREDRDGIGVGLDQIRHNFGELRFIF